MLIFYIHLKYIKKDNFIALTKNTSIIKNFINKNFYLLLNNKIIQKI